VKTTQQHDRKNAPHPPSRIPKGSVFFEKIVPVLLVVMGILTIGLILFALGILLGLIQF